MKTQLLTPDLIQTFYQMLLDYFMRNLAEPYNTEVHAQRMITQALAGRFQVWALLREKDGEKPFLLGFASTIISEDPLTAEREVWINTLNGNGHITDDDWAEAFRQLGMFAKLQNCTKICCQTRDEKLAHLAERRGMKSTRQYYELEV
jgi:hypothetical protein